MILWFIANLGMSSPQGQADIFKSLMQVYGMMRAFVAIMQLVENAPD